MSDTSDASRYVHPTQLSPGAEQLPEALVGQWQEHGWCLVDGLLSEDLIDTVIREGTSAFAGEAMESTFGSGGMMEFPTRFDGVNATTLHAGIIRSVKQLLKTENVLLSQSDLWVKRGAPSAADKKYDHSDQRVHMDYPNHTLVHPPRWESPEAVSLIVYFSDAEETEGRTAVIPKRGATDENYAYPYTNMPGFGALKWVNDKGSAEASVREASEEMHSFRGKLYAQEGYVNFKKGTVLFYRHDLWHRGTPIKPEQQRIVQNLVFKKRDAHWLNQWNMGCARHMYEEAQTVERLIATATPEQRAVLGIPLPGSPFWTEDTINVFKLRYGPLGLDATPYENHTGKVR